MPWIHSCSVSYYFDPWWHTNLILFPISLVVQFILHLGCRTLTKRCYQVGMEESSKRRNRHRYEVHEIIDFVTWKQCWIVNSWINFFIYIFVNARYGGARPGDRTMVRSICRYRAWIRHVYLHKPRIIFQIKSLSESKQNLISYKIRTMGCICTSLFNMYTLYRCQNSSLKITKLVRKFLNPSFIKKKRK